MKRYLFRAFVGLFLAAVLLSHVMGRIHIPYVDEMENLMYDTRVRLTAPGGKDERIVIVAIDEASLQELGHWPFTRDKLAVLVRQLNNYNVAVIGFDVVFAERDLSADIDLLRELGQQVEDEHFLQRLNEFAPQLDRDRVFAAAIGEGSVVLGY